MRNRINTFGRQAALALGLLAACGLSWSCKDDYRWDDEKPTWLNSSIYESLQDGIKDEHGNVVHSFNNYVRLLEDKDVNTKGVRDLKDVLSKTGSKTVFVADDQAWEAFFKANALLPETNPWHNATSYERLSPAQKLLLINTSMLNNAIVMENLASADGDGTNPPERGAYMRRVTDFNLTDSVTFLPANELPFTYNTTDIKAGRDYWQDFREENGGKGIYLVMDSTVSMMLHFTQEHMAKQQITNNDFKMFMGRERETRDVHIYDAKIIAQDLVAENGYVNVTEKVIKPLPNMAELIRTNGKTKIFSHMLDRLSFPYPNAAVTEDYKKLHPNFEGTIYTKKYFSVLGAGRLSQKVGPDGKTFSDEEGEVNLQFDPGWNEFSYNTDRRVDMAAMFVPNDEALMDYFSEGGAGWQLVLTYSPDPYAEVPPGDYDALYQKIDWIPLSTLDKLLNVIMFPSFNSSVPSKMTTLRDYQSQEEMFTPDDLEKIDTCMLACNGAVYVMDQVYGPAAYISVAAPANISKTNLIMKWAINNGDDYTKDQMHMNYFAYLMAMRSNFTFFLPSDEALKRYYDPVSFTSRKPRVIQMSYTGRGNLPVQTGRILYIYNLEDGTIGNIYNLDQLQSTELINRLKDILESHTIVHDATNPIDNEDEYYIAKNNAALKVTKNAQHEIVKVQGGFQLENERSGIVNGDRGTLSVEVTQSNTNRMANGTTFIIDDSPIIPTSKSVYGIIHNEFGEECSAFYDLTDMNSNEDIIKACGLGLDKLAVWLDAKSSGGVDNNVKFWNNYQYTLLVPSNEAINNARENGLPTWDDIRADFESLPTDPDDPEEHVLNGEDSLRLQTKITYLSNFIRTHFIDRSIFEDKSELAENEYVTSSYDALNGVFVKVHISRSKQAGETRLFVRDDQGGKLYETTGDLRNIMARDMVCLNDPQGNYSGMKDSPTGKSSMNNIVLQSSSFAVIHQIDGVLNHEPLVNGRHDSAWADAASCKRYLRKHALPKTETILQQKELLHTLK
ncbi:MAG: hypothetical protein IJ209_08115 [Bacteroidaceae bacterium]|nr:hypothetical protein [Bacteroidaceae bacterium]